MPVFFVSLRLRPNDVLKLIYIVRTNMWTTFVFLIQLLDAKKKDALLGPAEK